MSRTIVVSDAFFAELQTIAGSPVYAPAPATTPTPSPALVVPLPANLASRTRMEVDLSWGPFVRKYSPLPLDDTNVFIGRFTAGPAQTNHPRLQAAESGGPAVMRLAMLVRLRDGQILRSSPVGSTQTQLMTFDPTPISGPFAAMMQNPVIEPGGEYAWVIWNVPGNKPSTMVMELYV